jgi:hypothetical protein
MIYPHPAIDQLTIPGTGIESARLIDASGRVVATTATYFNDHAALHWEGLADGIYQLHVLSATGGSVTAVAIRH